MKDSVFIYGVFLSVVMSKIDAKSWHRQVTVEVGAGKEDCYFLPDVKSGQSIEFEFQVITTNSQTGKLDLTARITSPHGTQLYEEVMQQDGSYNSDVSEEGDYRVCFNNMDSTWSDKTVYFEVEVNDPEDIYDDYIDSEELEEARKRNEDTESLFEMKVEDIKTAIQSVRVKIGKMRHFQWMLGAFMSKDTNQVESTMDKINFWSIVHLTIMIVVGALQVFMVRQLFEDKSFLYKFISNKN